MKTLLFFTLTLAAVAAEPTIKIKPEDGLALRDAEIEFHKAATKVQSLTSAELREAQKAQDIALQAFNALVVKMQQQYKCDKCGIDLKALTFTKPPESKAEKPADKKTAAVPVEKK